MRSFLFVFFLCIIFPFSGFSQWQMSTGLDGGKLTNMVSVDSMLFAISEGHGLYAKHDTGSWYSACQYTDFRHVKKAGHCLFLYCADFNYVVIRSFDNGLNWEGVPALDGHWYLWTIDTVVFSYNSSGLIRSFDYGNTFDTVEFPQTNLNVSYLYNDDSLIYCHLSDGSDVHKIFYTNDIGVSWDSLSVKGLSDYIPWWDIEHIKYLNGSFWLQTRSSGTGAKYAFIYVYNVGQKKWINVTKNLSDWMFHRDVTEYHGSVFVCINSFPVFTFNYIDSTWAQFTDASKLVNQFVHHHDDLYCATDQGACLLDTTGQWTGYYSGLHHRDITSISVSDEKVYLVANYELFISEDNGINFNRVANAYGNQVIDTDSVLYMISLHDFKMSWDEGFTWISYNDSIEEDIWKYKQLAISSNNYYLGTSRGVYRTSVDTICWSKIISDTISYYISTDDVEAIANTVLVSDGPPSFELYFSDDNGVTFSVMDDFCNFAVRDSIYYLFKDSIYKSVDLAQTWDKIPTDDPNNYIYDIIDTDGTLIVSGTKYYGGVLHIMKSHDMGENWDDIRDNLPGNSNSMFDVIEHIDVINNNLIAGVQKQGLWYRDDVFVDVKENIVPGKDDVLIFPNPAINHINCQLSTFNFQYKIWIYDMLGDIADVVDIPNGQQEIQIDVSDYATGIYIAVVRTENGIVWREKFIKK